MAGCDIPSGDDVLVIQLKRAVNAKQFDELRRAISTAMPEQRIMLVNGIDVESLVVLSSGESEDDGGSIYGS